MKQALLSKERPTLHSYLSIMWYTRTGYSVGWVDCCFWSGWTDDKPDLVVPVFVKNKNRDLGRARVLLNVTL